MKDIVSLALVLASVMLLALTNMNRIALTAAQNDFELDPFPAIVGYRPRTNVTEHASIDLDLQEMDGFLAEDPPNYSAAKDIYVNGKHSDKTTGKRTMQGFSTAWEKQQDWPLWKTYNEYFGSSTYGDDFVIEALDGTGRFQDASDAMRREGALKGAQYIVTWMYAIHEMYDATGDCERDDLDDNDGGAHAWDEAVAFWAGSLEGAKGDSSTGFLTYSLAQKRCPNFGTCLSDEGTRRMAQANNKALGHFNAGQIFLTLKDCDAAKKRLYQVVNQMTVPLIQGTLRYAYRVDPKVPNFPRTESGDKETAEGFTFAAAVLPQVHECSPDAAEVIKRNMALYNNADDRVPDGYEAVLEAFQSVYQCLGVKCSDIGEKKDEQTGEVVMPACEDPAEGKGSSSSSSMSGGEIAATVIGVCALALITLLIGYRYGASSNVKSHGPGIGQGNAAHDNGAATGEKADEENSMTPV